MAASQFRTAVARDPARVLLDVWTSEKAVRLAHALFGLALLLLFLSATATVEVGFTLQVSYLLAIAAVGIGLPFAGAGWFLLPPGIRYGACALVLVYLLMALFGDDAELASQGGRSGLRDLVYLVDLILGLLLLGLGVGLIRRGAGLAILLWAAAAGAAIGALYGIYQWFALRYSLPLSDINTALNSDGFSRGHRHQGVGLLGWERIRGTFKEPLFLATYLATAMPIVFVLAWRSQRGRRIALLAVSGLIATALLLTVSALTWGIAVAAMFATLAAWAIATGRSRASGALAASLALVVLMSPVVFTSPSILAGVTGRSGEDLELTSGNRTRAWDRALRVWSQKPALGHGVGQSSVRLSYRPDAAAVAPGLRAPVVLGSAQGLWAASLVDVGLVGLAAWLLLLGAIIWTLLRSAIRRPTAMRFALFSSGLIAIAVSQLSGDRMDLRVWLVLAVGLALACKGDAGQRRDSGDQAEQPSVHT